MRRWWLLLSVLVLMPTLVHAQANGRLQIHYLNVGHGDSAVVVSPGGHVVLFDFGPPDRCTQVVRYLRNLKISTLDSVVVSHYHSDHIGCASEVLAAFPAGRVYDRGGSYASPLFDDYVAATGSKRRSAPVGATILLESSSLPLAVTFVGKNGNAVPSLDEGDLGLIARLRYGDFEAVFGGDVGGSSAGVADADPQPGAEALSVTVSGSGTVSSSPNGIACATGTCSTSFPSGTRVTLTALPGPGEQFVGWSGACAGSGLCQLDMSDARTVRATFAAVRAAFQPLTISVQGSGSVTALSTGQSCPGACAVSYPTGNVAWLVPAAAPGWTFSNWTGGCTGKGLCAIVMTEPTAVGATFTRNPGGYPVCAALPRPESACNGDRPRAGCGDGKGSCAASLDAACTTHGGVTCLVCPGPDCPPEDAGLSPVVKDGAVRGWPISYGNIERSLASAIGQVEIYKVHEHGSRNASSLEWLEATRPMIAVVSVGTDKRLGLPHRETLDRIHGVGTHSYWTTRGAGAEPRTGWDYVGGDIVVEVAPGATTFSVTSSAGTHVYPMWAGGSTPLGSRTDADRDGLLDEWERAYGLDTAAGDGDNGPGGDPDGDGATNLDELLAGTHPRGFVRHYLAEGATSAFFETRLALMNPSPRPAHVWLRFDKAGAGSVIYPLIVGPTTRVTLDVGKTAGMDTADFSTTIEADEDIVVDRTMTWDADSYGSHAETSVQAASTTWFLAEGATHSGFDLFYLIQNPNAVDADVRVRYLLPRGLPITRVYHVPAQSRYSIWVNTEAAALASTDVSAEITSSQAIVVERSMYLGSGGRLFGAGHESAGVTQPATRWFLAEGATGPFFDLFVLIANPTVLFNPVQAQFLLPDGTTVVKNYQLEPGSRFNIWVDQEDVRLADTAVSTVITSQYPVVVERAMWWPGPTAASWIEGHNAAGTTVTGRTWGLAEGEIGGSHDVETYILIANRGAADTARVTLYYEDGTTESTTIALPASSRTNVAVAADFPNSHGRRFGAIIEALGANPQIVVERAMYSNSGGVSWAAGTVTVATKLQ